jgi:hypothetical protein
MQSARGRRAPASADRGQPQRLRDPAGLASGYGENVASENAQPPDGDGQAGVPPAPDEGPQPVPPPHPALPAQPGQPTQPDPWLLRASDSDREAYVAVLQGAYVDGRLSKVEYDERIAQAYSATTYAELRPLLADLPVGPGDVPGPPVQRATDAVVAATSGAERILPAGAKADQPQIVAILTESRREGRWAVGSTTTAIAVLGSVRLDLAGAVLESNNLEIRANAILGSIDIEVPADFRVELTGVGVLGEFTHKNEADRTEGAAFVLTVSGVALLGSVTVTTVPGRTGLP